MGYLGSAAQSLLFFSLFLFLFNKIEIGREKRLLILACAYLFSDRVSFFLFNSSPMGDPVPEILDNSRCNSRDLHCVRLFFLIRLIYVFSNGIEYSEFLFLFIFCKYSYRDYHKKFYSFL